MGFNPQHPNVLSKIKTGLLKTKYENTKYGIREYVVFCWRPLEYAENTFWCFWPREPIIGRFMKKFFLQHTFVQLLHHSNTLKHFTAKLMRYSA